MSIGPSNIIAVQDQFLIPGPSVIKTIIPCEPTVGFCSLNGLNNSRMRESHASLKLNEVARCQRLLRLDTSHQRIALLGQSTTLIDRTADISWHEVHGHSPPAESFRDSTLDDVLTLPSSPEFTETLNFYNARMMAAVSCHQHAFSVGS